MTKAFGLFVHTNTALWQLKKNDTWGTIAYIIKTFFIFKLMYNTVPLDSNLLTCINFNLQRWKFQIYFWEYYSFTHLRHDRAYKFKDGVIFWVIIFNSYSSRQKSKPSIYLLQMSPWNTHTHTLVKLSYQKCTSEYNTFMCSKAGEAYEAHPDENKGYLFRARETATITRTWQRVKGRHESEEAP